MCPSTFYLAVQADETFIEIGLDTKRADLLIAASVCTLDNRAEMVHSLAFFLLIDNHHLEHSQQEICVYEVLGLFDDIPHSHPKNFPQF